MIRRAGQKYKPCLLAPIVTTVSPMGNNDKAKPPAPPPVHAANVNVTNLDDDWFAQPRQDRWIGPATTLCGLTNTKLPTTPLLPRSRITCGACQAVVLAYPQLANRAAALAEER